jgi:hypothetical protein
MEKEKNKKYLIVGTWKGERQSTVKELTPEHYESLKSKIGKYNRSGNTIIALYELDEE